MRRLAMVICVVALLGGCAKPPMDEIAALKRRGVDTSALDQELRMQTNKFALFRSYKRTDEIVQALKSGLPVPETAVYTSGTAGYAPVKCVEDSGLVCYCIHSGISCVERSK